MEMFEDKLETLMLSKAFEKLDPKDRAYVLNHVTEVEYTKCHVVLKNMVQALEDGEMYPVPNPDIAGILKERFDAKFLPVKTPFFFNIVQPRVLYGAVAVIALVALISSIFIINKTNNKISTEEQHRVTKSAPVKVKEKVDKFKRTTPTSIVANSPNVNIKNKKTVMAVQAKIKKDTTVNITPELIGLHVFEPLLCLDIDITEQLLCLDDQTFKN